MGQLLFFSVNEKVRGKKKIEILFWKVGNDTQNPQSGNQLHTKNDDDDDF
jgi:hypothetical protein